jgi:hypothetical protein
MNCAEEQAAVINCLRSLRYHGFRYFASNSQSDLLRSLEKRGQVFRKEDILV